jgi:2-polyprenyl-6-methoxyphenol hydroxylase-like FAD-dependent oxidoreductase
MACGRSGYVGATVVEGGRVEGCRVEVAAAVDPHALSNARCPGALVHRILREAGFPSWPDLEAAAWRGTPPLTRRTSPLAGRRWLLIGDAAGYVEPFTGEGIGWAMHSGAMAADLLGDSRDAGSDEILERWARLYQRTLASHQRSCRVISQLLRVKPLRQLAVWSLRRAPSISRPIVRRLDQPLATSVS